MTRSTNPFVELRALFDRAADQAGADVAAAVVAARDRLDEPLRVAIAGRVKAGKSTLLNALVGERLAPTDAGECTKVVTWYRHGPAYDVNAIGVDGSSTPVAFRRDRDQLVIDEGGFDSESTDRLEVTWPSARLRRFTLIDTPGLEAHDETSAERTSRLLGITDGDRSTVDAVIYLMRHVHRLDIDFLDSFTDRSLAHPSPVNAIAVLSRADEIGAGRPDALDSARAIAERYSGDSRIRNLCVTVVPVAGLIAETGRTLQESEGGSLRALAGLPADEVEAMQMSVDRFIDPQRSPIDSTTRQDLLLRLGLFGVRYGLARLQRAEETTSDLARALIGVSGADDLATLLESHFGRRATLLKIRSALGNLKSVVATLPDSTERHDLIADIERLEAAAPQLAELRLLHLVISGAAGLDAEETSEVNRLVSDENPAARLGMPDATDTEALQSVAIERLDVWRRHAAFPLASSERREACELVATEYERLYAELTSPGQARDLTTNTNYSL